MNDIDPFLKLDISISLKEDNFKLTPYSEYQFTEFAELYLISNYDEILNLFDQKINLSELKPDICYVLKMRYNNLIHHVDDLKTSLNYYISTDCEITNFFCDDTGEIEKSNRNKHTDRNNLFKLKSFMARPGDIYLMNNKIIHNVESVNKFIKNRTLLKWGWHDTHINEIIKKLKYF